MPSRPTTLQTIALTVIGGALLALVIGVIVISAGVLPANADAKPGRMETWAAKRSLHATLDREGAALRDPLPVNDSTLTQGVRLYGTYCATCHGTSDGKPSAIARGLYQAPPQFAKHDVADDPVGITYWKVTHGIRYTGMPAFDSTLTTEQRWTVATFLARQDSLTPGAEAAWKALPSAVESIPAAPAPAVEERAQERPPAPSHERAQERRSRGVAIAAPALPGFIARWSAGP